MRKILAILLLAVLPLAAQAQNETVTITASDVIGPWKLGFPLWPTVDRMQVKFGRMTDLFCRVYGMKDDLHIICFPRSDLGLLPQGDVSLNGDNFHVAWGSMMMRMSIDATEKSAGIFTGNVRIKLAGIIVARTEDFAISRVVPSQTFPDGDGKSAAVQKVLADVAGGGSVPPMYSVTKDWLPRMAESLRLLGDVEGVAYLGNLLSLAETLKERPQGHAQIDASPTPPNDNPVDVFAVDFAKGERLCGLRRRPDGAVDGFDCL